jgi:hypothetical protein
LLPLLEALLLWPVSIRRWIMSGSAEIYGGVRFRTRNSSHGEVLWNPGNRLYKIRRVKRGDCLKGMSPKPKHVTYRAGDDEEKKCVGKKTKILSYAIGRENRKQIIGLTSCWCQGAEYSPVHDTLRLSRVVFTHTRKLGIVISIMNYSKDFNIPIFRILPRRHED